ncbi:uncharacterized protein LOC135156815 [Lytechinus pictus]|uniref:uncharacterized protein LOC135156815 n=1 Tax=Lytechinus pictus TaxID=7653 RepID=UPI0030B9D1B7
MASRSYYSLSTTHRNKGETRQRVVAPAITTHHAQPSATLQPKGSSHGQQNYMKPDKRGQQQQQDSKKYGYFSRSESVRRSGKRLAAKRCETGDSEAAKLTGKLKILIKTKSSCFSIRVCGAKELKIPSRTQECRLYARVSMHFLYAE